MSSVVEGDRVRDARVVSPAGASCRHAAANVVRLLERRHLHAGTAQTCGARCARQTRTDDVDRRADAKRQLGAGGRGVSGFEGHAES